MIPKKGQTSEWILTIGILLAFTILLVQVKQVIIYQIKTSEASALESEATQIASIIDSIGSINGYAETIYKIRKDLNYNLTINDKLIKIKNLRNNQTAFAYFSYPCVYNTSFENNREIIIKKENDCIEVENYTPPIPCNEIDDCPSGYCWGDEQDEYYCHSECGKEAKYAPEKEDCCFAWNSTTKECIISHTTVLIVAIKSNMKKVYSDDNIKNLEESINNWMESMKSDNLNPKFFYLDEDVTENEIGSKLENPEDTTDIEGILNLLIKKENAKYLIIVGGFDRFPQINLGSEDLEYYSDDPYGDIDRDGKYIPDIPIGRIPDPNDGNIDELIKAIKTYTKLHKNGGIYLKTHIQPIMGCGGFDNRNWNSGKCFCKYIFGSSTCDSNSDCGCITIDKTSGKNFVMILAHGPGPSKCDLLLGGCITSGTSTCKDHVSFGPNDMFNLDTQDALWMSMACGGGNIRLKDTLSDSIAMSFLYNGGAIFIGSTNLNYGALGSDCPIPGGDCCIGSLYTEMAKRFSVGSRIGDAFLNGKLAFIDYPTNYNCNCNGLNEYQYHINCFYGDPTLKIKSKW